jgi:hypothetical protein
VADSESERRRGWNSLEERSSKESGRSSAIVRASPWPDGFGSGSSLSVTDVLSPSYGLPARVGRLRGYGNAIVPQVAEQFIRATGLAE